MAFGVSAVQRLLGAVATLVIGIGFAFGSGVGRRGGVGLGVRGTMQRLFNPAAAWFSSSNICSMWISSLTKGAVNEVEGGKWLFLDRVKFEEAAADRLGLFETISLSCASLRKHIVPVRRYTSRNAKVHLRQHPLLVRHRFLSRAGFGDLISSSTFSRC